jgi:chemotaxis protein methyltransferase CheR
VILSAIRTEVSVGNAAHAVGLSECPAFQRGGEDPFRHIEFSGRPGAARALYLRPPRRVLRPPIQRDDAEAVSPEEQDFFNWLLAQAGLAGHRYRSRPLHRRLAACLRAIQARSVDEAMRKLQREPWRLPAAVSAAVLGVTAFFRDGPVFEQLHAVVLPELLRSHRAIRVWSAACSDGAELYSVAMLLAELGALHRAMLLGTDCRNSAVETARRGEYDGAAATAVETDLLDRYSEALPAGRRRRLLPLLRSACQWRAEDVFACTDVATWDLILCRNLAIYLEPVASAELWTSLTRALRPGGYLVMGKAERPCRDLPLARVGACIYRRQPEC